MATERIFLTEDQTAEEIREVMRILGEERMPTAPEIRMLGKEYLHNKISRTKKYRGWAEFLGVPLKSSTTSLGDDYEEVVAGKLRGMGYEVHQMTTKHPYDLFVNGGVKIDVKCANKYKDKYEFDAWTFNLNKSNPTCDIYIFVALNPDGTIQRELVVPSVFVTQRVVTIGKVSAYDQYHERYDYVRQYVDFVEKVTQL